MPTPVTVARQCLTAEAAHVLDEAVAVARRRGHAQTTSLHAVSALLSLPSSELREACARSRGGGGPLFPTRLQFKALELCLSVSLDRVPSASGQLADNPPVSNSLMAAIKRSQANQRRQPENFHLYHQLSGQSAINNAIKVELQQLIISILDDPVVSRVFDDAGFRSSEIKLAILRPLPHLFRFSGRSRGPPVFLCGLDPGQGRLRFPFPVLPGISPGGGDPNCRRIADVLLGRSGGRRNPLLVGAYAQSALRDFIQTLGNNNRAKPDAVFPQELSRLSVMNIETDISDGSVNEKLDEADCKLNAQLPGEVLVVSFGDLKAFLGSETDNSESDPGISCIVARLTSLLEAHHGKVRLIGSSDSNDMYSNFLVKFPFVEKQWELQLLPITTTLRPSLEESCHRPSLMESFVPFAGLFPSCVDYNGQVTGSSPYQYLSQSNMCPEKERGSETIPIHKSASFASSLAGQYHYSLPSWMQMNSNELATSVKANNERGSMSSTFTGLQKEWDGNFKLADQSPQVPVSNTYRVDSHVKTISGFLPVEERSERTDDQSINGAGCKSVNSSLSADSPNISRPQLSLSPPQVVPSPNSGKMESVLAKLWEKSSRPEDMESTLHGCGSISGIDDGCRGSPASASSTTTNLSQRIYCEPDSQDLMKFPFQTHSSPTDISEQFLNDDFKSVYKALTEKVGRQQEAISVVSQMVARFRARNPNSHRQMSSRGDVWLALLGPDRLAKLKVAASICEILYQSYEYLIHIDLSSQSDDMNQRGKTPVDIIAGELSKKPQCVVLLENVDKADEQVQSSLLQAILTGKFSDSIGREIKVHRSFFMATLSSMKPGNLHSHELDGTASRFSEECVLRAKRWPMKVLVKHVDDSAVCVSSPMHANKRKLMGLAKDEASCESLETVNKRLYRVSSRGLDLNLPAESDESQDSDCSIEGDVVSDNSKAWLLDFMDRTDATVVFKPFDFDLLAQKISKEIRERLYQTVGLECQVDIEPKVMEQLLSAIYRSDGDGKTLNDWIYHVLIREFNQVQRQHKLTDHSTIKLVANDDSCLPCKNSVN